LLHEQFQTVSIPNRPPPTLAVEPSIWTSAFGGSVIVLNFNSKAGAASEANGKKMMIAMQVFVATLRI
jgi:hypothetical protein